VIIAEVEMHAGGKLTAAIVVCCLTAASARTTRTEPCLYPGQELTSQHMLLSGRAVYRLCDLEAATSYHVRLSYPASVPTVFTLTLQSPNKVSVRGAGRRVLNTEQIGMATDAEGLVVTASGAKHSEPLLQITARVEGVTHGIGVDRTDAVFNIIVDPLWHGIPARSLSMGWALLIAVFVLFGVLLPCMLSSRTSLLHWAASAAEDHSFSSSHQRTE